MAQKGGVEKGSPEKTGSWFSITAEGRRYFEIFRLYWPLILSLGIFYGWMLTFPWRGQLFYSLVQGTQQSPLAILTAFFSGHILGLLITGIVIFYLRKITIWFFLAAIPCSLLGIIITSVSPPDWWPLFLLLGLFSGMVITAWGCCFSASVTAANRGRTFIMAAFISGLIAYLFNHFYISGIKPAVLINALSFVPLAVPLIMALYYHHEQVPHEISLLRTGDEIQVDSGGRWKLFLFVLIIYMVGGMLFYMVKALSAYPAGSLHYFKLMPYLLILLLSGSLGDLRGRRVLALVGTIMVGLGFMMVGMLKEGALFVTVQIFLVGGFALLDTFVWVSAADLSPHPRQSPLYFSLLMSILTVALMLGSIIGGEINSNLLLVSLAGIFVLMALIISFFMRETLQMKLPPVSRQALEALKIYARKVDLTPREMDIAVLLISGATTEEILAKLIITPNTLKSHLRNIYRKAGARNRLEFTLAVMKEENPPDR